MRKNDTYRLKAIYNQVNGLSGGSLDILSRAIQRFNATRASEAAASMAYYTVFSLFPLLLALIAVGSFVLSRQQIQQQLMKSVEEALPVSQVLIEKNIQRVLELRGTVGIVGLIGLLWSATGVFTTLTNNVNRAWPGADPRSFLKRRLVALGIVGGLAGLLIFSLASTAVVNLLPWLSVPLLGSVSLYATSLWAILSNLIPWLFKVFMFLALYLWVPTVEVKWSAALLGALVAALAWELVTAAFTWYLSSGLASYELVYGSLGTIVALMFWIYLSSWITLFGAHLSAAIARPSG